jgi:GMP synthase (glutamine-hydrolysing)
MSILVVDFGSQYTHLIYHKTKYYLGLDATLIDSDEFNKIIDVIKSGESKYNVIVLSGGPKFFGIGDDEKLGWRVDELPVDVVGICYGAQIMAMEKGYKFDYLTGEYGKTIVHDETTEIRYENDQEVEYKIRGDNRVVWMSHKSFINKDSGKGLEFLAWCQNGFPVSWTYSDFVGEKRLQYIRTGLQYHPEVDHTEGGLEELMFCYCANNYIPPYDGSKLISEIKDDLLSVVGENDRLYLALSGGVDSSTLALFLSCHLKSEQLRFYLVDTKLMRKGEIGECMEELGKCLSKDSLMLLDSGSYFLDNLKGVEDPEVKRKVIGKCFIDIFEKAITDDMKNEPIVGKGYFVQGTIYPDVIESGKTKNSEVIKSHHNVGGLPETLPCQLLEPFKGIYKNDIRMIGEVLGLPKKILNRHPFPGPGLGIRILGEVTLDKVKILQEADWIYRKEIIDRGLDVLMWQNAVILLPIRTVGVKGDNRSYEYVVALRAVTSNNGMTAEPSTIPIHELIEIANIIQKNVNGINRVVYDLSSKPPATIEWE